MVLKIGVCLPLLPLLLPLALGCYFPRGRIGLKGISVSLARQMLEGNAAAAAAARAGDEMGP